MKVGDRVRNIYPPHYTGIVIAIGDWDYDFNPYKIMIEIDGKDRAGNFEEDSLIIQKEVKDGQD